jgi:hypothetical protein
MAFRPGASFETRVKNALLRMRAEFFRARVRRDFISQNVSKIYL